MKFYYGINLLFPMQSENRAEQFVADIAERVVF